MPVFRSRNRVEILRDMIARVIARSSLAGLTRNSVVYHILAAAATEDAETYFQLARLRDLFSIDRATGSDLDERAREIQPAVITRELALYATGLVIFSRPGTTGLINIPAGTIVAAADAAGSIRFRTTAAGSIPNLSMVSAPIPITAIEAGARGNVVADTLTTPGIRSIVTRIPGVTGVTNPTALTNGRNRESDQDFRARIKGFVRALARGTIQAIEVAVRSTRLPDGAKVVFAKVEEDAFTPGVVYVYIDDSTGSVESFDSTYIASYDVILNPALGGERRVFTTQGPIRDDGSFVLEVNAVPQVRGTSDSPGIDYVLNPSTGQITFTTSSYPTGLTAGDVVRAKYRYYTRLIQEAQRIVNGVASNPLAYPGYRAAGIRATVLAPTTVPQTIVAGIAVADDFDTILVAQQVATAIQQYINGLNIGEDVIVAQIIEVAMAVDGMTDFQITELTGSTPPVNQVILDHQVARIAATNITLV